MIIHYKEILAVEKILKKIEIDILWQEEYSEEFEIIKKSLEHYLSDIKDTYADQEYSRIKDENLDRM